MAIATVTNTKIKRNELVEIPAFTAVDGTAGLEVGYTAPDGKILLEITNGHADTAKSVTIKGGNAIGIGTDITLSIAAGKTYGIVLESARYVNASGTYKGKVVITGTSTDIKVRAIVLP